MKSVVLAAFVVAAAVAVPSAQDSGPLHTAKELYASARYDEALTVLNSLRGNADRRSVEQYRSLCLLALGRASEAESAIAAVVAADPLYRPGDDASPRVRTMFSDVRKRMLAEIATSRYAAAKATYDRQKWAEAEQQFRLVLSLIDDPDAGGKLTDLRMLATGFLELSARAAAPPPEPAKPEPAPPAPVPLPAAATGKSGPPASERSATPQATGPIAGKIYVVDDADVVPPVIVRQEIPSVPVNVITMAKPRGLLEIVIDEQGRVINMTIRGSIYHTYDAMLLAAARDWKYKPATVEGQPVRFKKLIQVTVKR